ncbi:uncharacterized protein LOC131935044 [Physella acuta]|uniref:uncharacterized protein LOC131935044 n=1 Tax=Physella acuta TaxID=109671 RepID=UPI0027DE7AE7|nr:uncharacterized protein LOC131935044 [Physella acuta]XP_059147305.1 uncharacterized protein LOC131935044 [Physella acuta]
MSRVVSRTSSSRLEPLAAGSLNLDGQFYFDNKTSFDAEDGLLQTRSQTFKAQAEKVEPDIWKRPPPDFRYLVYDPQPPKRNTVDAMRPWIYGTIPGQREVIKRDRGDKRLPRILEHQEKEPQIVTRFRIDRPFTAKKKFVQQGMYKPGTYECPKPHDFRQYPPIKSLGLDEFVTDYERDPYGLNFKSQRLNHIHGLPREPPERDLAEGRQMAPPQSAKKKWDARLILDRDNWPQKSAAFSRHRRRHRQAYSAFMERVEETLNKKWFFEQTDKSVGCV